MLYEDYMVTDCGLNENSGQTIYFCDLLGLREHKINFNLIIKGCVGEKDYRAKYDAVAPHIQVGNLLHCEFVWQWHDCYLNLCISGFLCLKPYGAGKGEISSRDFLNPNRGYWVHTETVGEWITFPGNIHCGGEAFIRTDFEGPYPRLSAFNSDLSKGELVWRPKQESGRVRRTFERIFPYLARA